jgi:hypothetical protein
MMTMAVTLLQPVDQPRFILTIPYGGEEIVAVSMPS